MGEGFDGLVQPLFQLEARHEIGGRSCDCIVIHEEQLACKAKELPRSQLFVEEWKIRDIRESSPGFERLGLNIEPGNSCGSARWLDQPYEHLDGGRLTGCIGTEDAEELASGYRQPDPVDGAYLGKVFDQVYELDHPQKDSVGPQAFAPVCDRLETSLEARLGRTFTPRSAMILPQLLWRFARHRDDRVFYAMQATDAIRWLRHSGVRLGGGVRVLDLGCGHGVFGGELRKLGCEVVFADESNHLLPEHRDARFLPVNLDRDSLDSLGEYDLVICSNVLEHLAQPRRFLASARCLMKPGGRIYLSWTNWLSPWGGHEFSPLHFLGPRLGSRLFDALGGKRFHRPGENLFVTHIGRTLDWLEQDGALEVEAMAPRYYTEFAGLVRLPGIREFVTWNCSLLLRSQRQEG